MIEIAIWAGAVAVAIVIIAILFALIDKSAKAPTGLFRADYQGNSIEFECSLSGNTYNHSLIINNERVDHTEGTGNLTLRGTLPGRDGKSETVILKIEHRTIQHEYTLEIDGIEHPIKKV